MKILNQAKSMNAIKYFQLIVLSCLTLLIKAQTPNIPTITCGKLNMSWTLTNANLYTYEVQILKNGTPIGSTYTTTLGLTNYTFPSAANEVLESGNYTFKVRINSGSWSSSPIILYQFALATQLQLLI